MTDVELDVCSLNAEQWVKSVVFAPGEPSTELVGVQNVGVTGVPRQVRDSSELGRGHGIGLERQERGCRHWWHLATENTPRHGSPRLW